MNNRLKNIISQQTARLDIPLLLFLVLLTDVKLVVKLVAIVFIYCLRPDFRFGFGSRRKRLPSFYLYILLIALLNFCLYAGSSPAHYATAFALGLVYWLLCLLTVHQVALAAEKNTAAVQHRTISAFFLINCLVSLAILALIIADAESWNPYRYQGMHQKYFISTGDYIKGITFDTSTTNAVLCAIGVVYFLHRKQLTMLLLCMATLLLTASNLTVLLVSALLLLLFVWKSDRLQKSAIVICWALLVVFMSKISPQNDTYALKLLHLLPAPLPAAEEVIRGEREKIAIHYLDSIHEARIVQSKPAHAPAQTMHAVSNTAAAGTPIVTPALLTNNRPVIEQPSIHSEPFQRRRDTSAMQRALLAHIQQDSSRIQFSAAYQNKPGKLIAFLQTIAFFRQHPAMLLSGTGMGNFSSKLAFKTTGFQINGSYPAGSVYIHPAFRANHLATYLHFFSEDAELHSVANTPNTVYNQLAGEYGLLGLLAFLYGYLYFFAKPYRRLHYTLPLLLLLCGIFLSDYWFEQLSVIPVFELLLFLDRKEKTVPVSSL